MWRIPLLYQIEIRRSTGYEIIQGGKFLGGLTTPHKQTHESPPPTQTTQPGLGIYRPKIYFVLSDHINVNLNI